MTQAILFGSHKLRRSNRGTIVARVAASASYRPRGAWVDPSLSRITLEDWADRWVRTTVHLKPKTQAGYESLLRSHVLPAFGRTPLGRIHQVDVREWVSRLSQSGLSPSRTRQAYQVLSALLKAAVESGLLARTPCVGVKLPRLTRREMRFLTADQVAELARVVGAPYDTLIYTLAYGGLRWGEAAALRRGRCQLIRSRLEIVESLAEVDGRLYFGPTKTYQRRVVALPAFLRDMLAAHLTGVGREGESLVFQGPQGGPLRHSNFRGRVWLPAVEAAGLPKGLRIHDLRHTCAALLVAQGAHPKAIQAHLGHSSIQVTLDLYGHLFPDEMDRLAERLDAANAAVSPRVAAFSRHSGDGEVIELRSERENRASHQHVSEWGGLDSNQRPTDYESANWEAADLQEFLNVLVRGIT